MPTQNNTIPDQYKILDGKIIAPGNNILSIEEVLIHLNQTTAAAIVATQIVGDANTRLNFYAVNWVKTKSLSNNALTTVPNRELMFDGGKRAAQFNEQFEIANQG